MGDFSQRVYQVVRQIPKGCVASYGTVARLMGSPRSARYVGFALRNNPEPGTELTSIPCHRVVFKDGSLCEGFVFGGPGVQRELLMSESVLFCDNDHIDMKACEWDGRGFCPQSEELPVAPPEGFDWQAELGEDA